MKNPIIDLKRYRDFLETIPLDKYRSELKNIKWIEQDLPKKILPLTSIYQHYWENREYLQFENWFEKFWEEINTDEESKGVLENFKKYYFNKSLEENDWFKKGFKARMYRTWISVLTQLDFCYMFEYICAKKNISLKLECNAELDARGIDAKVNNICLQIAKISQRKEARPAKRKNIIPIPYMVLDIEEYKRKINSKRVRNQSVYQKTLEVFFKYFDILKNGFVVFKENYVEKIIDNIHNEQKLMQEINEILNELSGKS